MFFNGLYFWWVFEKYTNPFTLGRYYLYGGNTLVLRAFNEEKRFSLRNLIKIDLNSLISPSVGL